MGKVIASKRFVYFNILKRFPLIMNTRGVTFNQVRKENGGSIEEIETVQGKGNRMARGLVIVGLVSVRVGVWSFETQVTNNNSFSATNVFFFQFFPCLSTEARGNTISCQLVHRNSRPLMSQRQVSLGFLNVHHIHAANYQPMEVHGFTYTFMLLSKYRTAPHQQTNI